MLNRTRLFAALSTLTLGLGACASLPLQTNPVVLALFGPPRPELSEAYAESGSGARFDHSGFDQLLRAHVADFQVDYDGLRAEEASLDRYLESVATAPFDALDRDAKLAFLINAYNAFTLKLILDNGGSELASIRDIPSAERWDAERWTLAGRTVSLSSLEHEELRAKFVEPRIHFAINCASVGCPPLRNEAYTADRLEEQLEDQARIIHTDPRWTQIEGRTVQLSSLYLWYESDFSQVAGSSLGFASTWRPELAEGEWKIVWKDYDWALNR